jgi:spore coat protein SA
MRQEALRFFPDLKKSFVLYNGVDDSVFYPSALEHLGDKTPPVVLYVGRLDPAKGVDVLMEAMKVLRERRVDVLCRVVGASFSGGGKTSSYARRLLCRLPPNVQYASYRPTTEIAQEFRTADILCCPSICQEAFGKVLIEAMASGLPVVATRVGGIPEVAAEGGVLLVKSGSAVELADAIQSLIENKDLRTLTAADGLKSCRRRFRWEVVLDHYQEIQRCI